MTACNALVFDIYRGTTHDGPGIRNTVFFKGCPLRCAWCQNPEGIDPGNGIWWDRDKCLGCDLCADVCMTGAIRSARVGAKTGGSAGGGAEMVRDAGGKPGGCIMCGRCVSECPSKALEFIGKRYTVPELVNQMLKYKQYFDVSGGGVTASGGEPLIQYLFVAEFFRSMRENGIHTALDTCGFAEKAAISAVLPYSSLIMYDIKLIDPALHMHYTGKSNDTILGNFIYISEYLRRISERGTGHQAQRPEDRGGLWVRTPLIPNATAYDDNIYEIGSFIKKNAGNIVSRWELCTFNRACKNKYDRFGLDWEFTEANPLQKEETDRLFRAAVRAGIDANKIVLSGIYITQEDPS